MSSSRAAATSNGLSSARPLKADTAAAKRPSLNSSTAPRFLFFHYDPTAAARRSGSAASSAVQAAAGGGPHSDEEEEDLLSERLNSVMIKRRAASLTQAAIDAPPAAAADSTAAPRPTKNGRATTNGTATAGEDVRPGDDGAAGGRSPREQHATTAPAPPLGGEEDGSSSASPVDSAWVSFRQLNRTAAPVPPVVNHGGKRRSEHDGGADEGDAAARTDDPRRSAGSRGTSPGSARSPSASKTRAADSVKPAAPEGRLRKSTSPRRGAAVSASLLKPTAASRARQAVSPTPRSESPKPLSTTPTSARRRGSVPREPVPLSTPVGERNRSRSVSPGAAAAGSSATPQSHAVTQGTTPPSSARRDAAYYFRRFSPILPKHDDDVEHRKPYDADEAARRETAACLRLYELAKEQDARIRERVQEGEYRKKAGEDAEIQKAAHRASGDGPVDPDELINRLYTKELRDQQRRRAELIAREERRLLHSLQHAPQGEASATRWESVKKESDRLREEEEKKNAERQKGIQERQKRFAEKYPITTESSGYDAALDHEIRKHHPGMFGNDDRPVGAAAAAASSASDRALVVHSSPSSRSVVHYVDCHDSGPCGCNRDHHIPPTQVMVRVVPPSDLAATFAHVQRTPPRTVVRTVTSPQQSTPRGSRSTSAQRSARHELSPGNSARLPLSQNASDFRAQRTASRTIAEDAPPVAATSPPPAASPVPSAPATNAADSGQLSRPAEDLTEVSPATTDDEGPS